MDRRKLLLALTTKFRLHNRVANSLRFLASENPGQPRADSTTAQSFPSLQEDFLSFPRDSRPHLESLDLQIDRKKWFYEEEKSCVFVDFRFLNSWEDVEKVVDSLGHELTDVHATAAFSRLRHLPLPDNTDFYQKLVEKTKLMLDGMSPRRLMLILYSSLRLEIDSSAFQEMLVKQLMKKDSPVVVQSSLLTNVMLALGAKRRRLLQQGQGHLLFPSEINFAKNIIQLTVKEDRIREFNELECIRMLYMFAHMQALFPPDYSLISSLCQQLLRSSFISRLNEMSTVALISSLALLNYPHPKLVDIVLKEVIQNGSLALYRDAELCHLAYCLGSLRHWNLEMFTLIFQEAISPRRLQNLTEMQLANLFYGISRHSDISGFEKEKYILPLLREAGRDHRMPNYITAGLTSVLYTAGVMKYPRGKLNQVLLPFLKELVSSEKLSTVSNQGLAVAFWGLAKTEVTEWPLLDLLSVEIMRKERLESFEQHGLSILAYSCGLLKYHNGKLMNTLVQEATKEGKQRLTNRDLCNFTFGLGRTSCAEPSLTYPILEECLKKERLESFECQHICNVLRMACKLKLGQENELIILLKEITKPDRLCALMPVEIREALLAMCTLPSLLRTPEAIVLIERCLEDDMLKSMNTPHLSSLCVAMSMAQPILQLEMKVKERFAQVITAEERINTFNPIDITNVYTTLITIGIQDEDQLERLMNVFSRIQPERKRKASQLIGAMTATSYIRKFSLRLKLYEKILQHLDADGCLDFFIPADAFGMLTALLKADSDLARHSSWLSVLHKCMPKAAECNFAREQDGYLVQCLSSATARSDNLPDGVPIGKLLLTKLTEKSTTTRLPEKVLVRCIFHVAAMRLETTHEQRKKVLENLLISLQAKKRLCALSQGDAVNLLRTLKEYAVLSVEEQEELLRASIDSEIHMEHRLQAIASSLEEVTGCIEN